jgi:hypothetical protein
MFNVNYVTSTHKNTAVRPSVSLCLLCNTFVGLRLTYWPPILLSDTPYTWGLSPMVFRNVTARVRKIIVLSKCIRSFVLCLNSYWWFVCNLWFIYPILRSFWCPELWTSSIDWTKLSRILLKDRDSPVSETSFLNKNMSMDNVRKSIAILIYHRHKLSDNIYFN